MGDRPDLVLFLTDQQRYDQIGYESDGYFDTPNIDALAQQGVVFTNAYSGSTTCVPSRSSLLTGLLPHRVLTQGNRLALREGFWTVARALRWAGYETALIGKMHFGPVRARHGFDTMRMCEHVDPIDFGPGSLRGTELLDDYHDWLVAQGLPEWRTEPSITTIDAERDAGRRYSFPYPLEAHPTSWVASEAVSFLQHRDRRRPLFLIVSFPHPHAPYNPPEPYDGLYELEETPLPNDGFRANDGLPDSFVAAMRAGIAFFPPHPLDGHEVEGRRWLTAVRALIKHIDDAIGAVLEHVDLPNSLVFFTSDHGDYAGHRGLLKKVPWIPFDDLSRVPLVVAGNGVPGGKKVGSVVQSCDFALTCLDYADVDVSSESFDTLSLRPLLEGRTTSVDTDRVVICATESGWPMVRKGPFKLVLDEASNVAALFDLAADPNETTNVLDDPAHALIASELLESLRGALARNIPANDELPSADLGTLHQTHPFQVPLSVVISDPFSEVQETEAALWWIDHLCMHLEQKDLGDTEMLDVGCQAGLTETFLNGAVPIKRYVGCGSEGPLIRFLRGQVLDPRFDYFQLPFQVGSCEDSRWSRHVDLEPQVTSSTFDLIVAASLFTHADPTSFAEVLAYLQQFARRDTVLIFALHIDEMTEGGYGLMDHLSRALAAGQAGDLSSIKDPAQFTKPFRYLDAERPLRWALYSEPYARELIESAGWRIERLEPPDRHIQHHFVCSLK